MNAETGSSPEPPAWHPLGLQHVLEQLTPQLELATRGEAPREHPS